MCVHILGFPHNAPLEGMLYTFLAAVEKCSHIPPPLYGHTRAFSKDDGMTSNVSGSKKCGGIRNDLRVSAGSMYCAKKRSALKISFLVRKGFEFISVQKSILTRLGTTEYIQNCIFCLFFLLALMLFLERLFFNI